MAQKANDPTGVSAPCRVEVQSEIPPKDQKMNKTEHSRPQAKVPVPIQLLRTVDVLGKAKDLTEAVYMACSSLEDNVAKLALQAVVSCLDTSLSDALSRVELAREDLA